MWHGWAWYSTPAWLSVLEGRSSAFHVQLRLCCVAWQLPVSVVCFHRQDCAKEQQGCGQTGLLSNMSRQYKPSLLPSPLLQAHNRNSDDAAWVGISLLYQVADLLPTTEASVGNQPKRFASWLKFDLGSVDIDHLKRRKAGLWARTTTVSTNVLPSCG